MQVCEKARYAMAILYYMTITISTRGIGVCASSFVSCFYSEGLIKKQTAKSEDLHAPLGSIGPGPDPTRLTPRFLYRKNIRSERNANYRSRGIIKKSTLKQLAEVSSIALWLHR